MTLNEISTALAIALLSLASRTDAEETTGGERLTVTGAAGFAYRGPTGAIEAHMRRSRFDSRDPICWFCRTGEESPNTLWPGPSVSLAVDYRIGRSPDAGWGARLAASRSQFGTVVAGHDQLVGEVDLTGTSYASALMLVRRVDNLHVAAGPSIHRLQVRVQTDPGAYGPHDGTDAVARPGFTVAAGLLVPHRPQKAFLEIGLQVHAVPSAEFGPYTFVGGPGERATLPRRALPFTHALLTVGLALRR